MDALSTPTIRIAAKINQRIKKVFKDHGIESEILGTRLLIKDLNGSKTPKRGVKVIITNLRLVEVGLDLKTWPTLIFYQGSYDINSVRQASRRSWRIGQTRECRVYYMIADGTQQVSQFQSCMLKRAHAMIAEGRLDRSELASYGRDTTSALAADLAECLADKNLGTKWTELAVKDLDIETIPEDEFQDVLRKTQKSLANETLRLCGIQEDEDDEEEIEIPKPSSWVDIYVIPRRRRKRNNCRVSYHYLTCWRRSVDDLSRYRRDYCCYRRNTLVAVQSPASTVSGTYAG